LRKRGILEAKIKAPTNTGLVGAWNFDEGSGNTANPNTGALIGTLQGPDWTTDSISGNAISFSSEDQDYATFPMSPTYDVTGVNSFSVSTWIKVDDFEPSGPLGSFRFIASGGMADNAGWLMYIRKYNGKLKLIFLDKHRLDDR